MEVSNQQPNPLQQALTRYRQARLELLDSNRDRVQGAREELVSFRPRAQQAQGDQVDLSRVAQATIDAYRRGEIEEPRSRLVDMLKKAYRQGDLNDPERVRRAAERMLRPAD